MILKQYISTFVTYKKTPGIYTTKDTADAVYKIGDHEGTLQSESDDISTKTNNIINRFVGNFGTLRFDDKSFFFNFFGFYNVFG